MVTSAGAEERVTTTASTDFSNSRNHGLQMGQNLGTVNAAFNSDSIGQVTIAAGASVYMGEKKTIEDKLLDALIAGDPADRHDIARADPGTCEWIFESAAFLDWIQTDPSTTTPLYIQGIPGSGKTVLLKFLIKELQTRLRLGTTPQSPTVGEKKLPPGVGVPGKTIAVGCFCDDQNEHRRTPIWILRTLLYKLFQHNRNLVKYALLHFQKLEDLDTTDRMGLDPDEFQSLDVLQKIFEDIVADPELEVLYLVIDGLDQCGPHMSAVVRLIDELATRVGSKVSSLGQKFSLRCIVSDRSSKIVRDKMCPQYTIDMPTGNQRDIDEVADRRVRSIQEYRNFSENIRQDITVLLRESSKGMFMWLSLVLDDLSTWEGVWTETRIKERLHSLPRDVETFYNAMLERQPREVVGRLRTLLMWVYFACRQLTLRELDVVLTLQEGKEYTGGTSSDEDLEALRHQIENSWGALFVIRDSTIHLSHQSVKDFLRHLFSDEGAKEYPRYGMSKSEAHRQIASACLAYLRIDEIQKLEVPKPPVNSDGIIDETELTAVKQRYLDGYPFLQYSVVFVGHHLRESQIQEETDVIGMKEFFASDSAALLHWVPSYDLLKRWMHGKYSGFSSSTSLLFVSARLNLPWLADRTTSWNKSIRSLPSAVCAPDMSGWSAIHIAADSEAVEMVAWLLKHGALVDAETMGFSRPGRTALHFAAAKSSDAGPQMVKELLKGRAKATVQTRQGGNTPLHYAIDGRSVETVETLLTFSADANVTNGSGITPLHKAAAVPGLEAVVEALLKGATDPNRKTSVGTVSAARGLATLKSSSNAKALMQTYYAVNTSQTALHIATKVKDTERTVDVLLKSGADANCQDSAGRTPLHVAVVGMDPEVNAKLLIDFGADVNAQDRDGKTPLLLFLQAIGTIAAKLQAENQPRLLSEFGGQASWERTVDLLLSAGANPSAEGKDKQSPISYATQAQLQWALDRLTQKPKEDDKPKADDQPDQQPIVSTIEIAVPEPDGVETRVKNFLGQAATGANMMKSSTKWLPKRSKQ